MAYVRHAYHSETPDNPDAEISSDEWNDDHDVDGLMPPGALAPFAGSSAPTGWLLCDGSAVSRTTYSALFDVISTAYGVGNGTTTFNVPNAKGRVLVGLDSGQTEFDALAETGGAKTHTLQTSEIPSHSHTQDAHTHTQDAHTHTQDAHTHTQNSHNHTQDSHTHGFTDARGATTGAATTTWSVGTSSVDSSSTATTLLTAAATATNQAATATNQNATATNQSATATNQNATATNQNTGGGGAHNNLQPYLVIHWIIKT